MFIVCVFRGLVLPELSVLCVLLTVMTFLESKPRSAAPHNPRIVLLGPTGSGKAVQAALLASKYNIVNGQLICGSEECTI